MYLSWPAQSRELWFALPCSTALICGKMFMPCQTRAGNLALFFSFLRWAFPIQSIFDYTSNLMCQGQLTESISRILTLSFGHWNSIAGGFGGSFKFQQLIECEGAGKSKHVTRTRPRKTKFFWLFLRSTTTCFTVPQFTIRIQYYALLCTIYCVDYHSGTTSIVLPSFKSGMNIHVLIIYS